MQLWLLRLLWLKWAEEACRSTIYPTKRFKQGYGCHFVVPFKEEATFLYVS